MGAKHEMAGLGREVCGGPRESLGEDSARAVVMPGGLPGFDRALADLVRLVAPCVVAFARTSGVRDRRDWCGSYRGRMKPAD
jgi:hypothetical protein